MIVRKHHCRRCGDVFCAACSKQKTRLPVWGHPREEVRVCGECARVAASEIALLERIVPVLQSGLTFRKYNLIRRPMVRVALGPFCRRLEYWEPPDVSRDATPELKGLDVATIGGVYDAGGNVIRLTGFDGGKEKQIVIETLSERGKGEWIDALRMLTKFRRLVTSQEFPSLLGRQRIPQRGRREERRQTEHEETEQQHRAERRTSALDQRRRERAERRSRIMEKYKR